MGHARWLSLLLLVSGHIPQLEANAERYSCDLQNKRAPRRELYYGGEKKTIVLLQTTRLQHKLINAVLGILFREIYGYTSIATMQPYGDNFETIASYFEYGHDNFPQALVNVGLELSELDPPGLEKAKSLGATGTTYRYRWYMHAAIDFDVENCTLARYLEFYADDKRVVACFKNKKFLNSSDPLFKGHNISKQSCTTGNICYVVLTAFKSKAESKKLTDHFEKLHLQISVILLGNHFHGIIEDLKLKKESFFIIDDIVWEDLQEIKTSGCKEVSTDINNNIQQTCPYNTKKQMKFVWKNTEKRYPLIYYTIQNIRINDFHIAKMTRIYRSKLKETSDNDTVEAAACEWMKSSFGLINGWTKDTKPEIVLHTLHCTEDKYSQHVSKDAAWHIEAYIKKTENLSLYLHVQPSILNCTSFASAMSVKEVCDMISADNFPKTAGVIFPSIPQFVDVMAGLSSIFGMPMITTGPNGPSFANRQIYPNMFRTIGEKINLKQAYLEFLKQNDWNRVAAISGYNQSNVDFISRFKENFRKTLLLKSVKITIDYNVRKCLEDLKSENARIIIVDVEEAQAPELFLAAYDLSMFTSEGFVWLLPEWTNVFHYGLENMVNKTQSMFIKKVLNGHFSLTFSSIANESGHDNVIQLRKILTNLDIIKQKAIDVPSVGLGSLADAISILTHAAHNLITNNTGAEDDIHSEKFVKILSQYIRNLRDFKGVSGNIEFYNGSSRHALIEVKQWLENDFNMTSTILARIRIDAADDNKTQWIPENEGLKGVVWKTKNKLKPSDGALNCIFENKTEFYPKCNNELYIFAIILIIIIVILFPIISVIYFRQNNKKINNLIELVTNTHKNLINRLQSYEVPRDNIELNWEIGKGSFGKVFGGYLKMDNNSWDQVAIKLLKCDANAEDENDFLYEAKTMASFDHKNIVKLMAVCTAGTPILIVMELMIHEDLKKFLVTKRHLVGDLDYEQIKFINPQGLTKMALDIAMGLSYLASKKFVHRDIASRNCMVNIHGVVKIGDFGMTRYVFNKGEYVCHRKGFFPVRWMAPESLTTGTFTSMSDMWSYGILIYEIITFGENPYRTIKENDKVKEFIVNGNIIRLPNTVNAELKWLIEQCWSYDDSQRPSAADVVVYLAGRPSLLRACVDAALERRSTGSRAVDTGDTVLLAMDCMHACSSDSTTLERRALRDDKNCCDDDVFNAD